MKIHGSDIVKEVASQVRDSKIEVVAQEEALSPTEEAFEHARAHWWMGWNWEEIDALLDDMGYTDSVTKNAISQTQQYARKVLNEGPFSMYKEGQLAKMKNGYIGQVADIFPEHVELVDLEDGYVVNASRDELDHSASLRLKEAYLLRLASYKLLRAAPEDEPKELVPQQPESPQMPDPPSHGMSVDPNRLEELQVKIGPRAPSGWKDLTPQFSEVEEVGSIVATALNQVEAAEAELAQVTGELKELNSMAAEYRAKQKSLKKEEAEIAKELFSIIGSENAALDDLESTVFYKYKDKLIGLQRAVEEKPSEPGPVDELMALKQVITRNFPDIADKTFEILEEWKQQNTVINEKIKETFAMYPPPKKKSGQLLEKMTGWIKGVWESIKGSINDMYNSLFPTVDSTVDAIDNFLVNAESYQRETAIEAALKQKGLT